MKLSLLRGAMLSMALLATTPWPAAAQDKQGKHSLEQNRSRPKENKPAQTGSQRTQDQTRQRTEKALSRNGSARQQESTRGRVNKALKKR